MPYEFICATGEACIQAPRTLVEWGPIALSFTSALLSGIGGAWAGAALAFYRDRKRSDRRQKLEQGTAGRLALFKLRTMAGWFNSYWVSNIEKLKDNPARWALLGFNPADHWANYGPPVSPTRPSWSG